jgi:glycosyltransferase involved in cell wall biosynthesis
VRLNCRGTRPEAVVYGAALALWQRRLAAQADVVVVPSRFAQQRLRELQAPLDHAKVRVVPHVLRDVADRSRAAAGEHALVASRLAPEKGVELAVEACARAGVPLVVAGDGPLAGRLRGAPGVRFAGDVAPAELAELRARAALAIVPSRAAETFGLAAAEAMAAGVPVVAAAVGALPELVGPDAVVAPGDADALAAAVRARYGDEAAGTAGLHRISALASPAAVSARLREIY